MDPLTKYSDFRGLLVSDFKQALTTVYQPESFQILSDSLHSESRPFCGRVINKPSIKTAESSDLIAEAIKELREIRGRGQNNPNRFCRQRLDDYEETQRSEHCLTD